MTAGCQTAMGIFLITSGSRLEAGAPRLSILASRNCAPKQKHHPTYAAAVFMLLLGCLLHQAQYLLTLQPILHVGRARLLSFPVSANLSFPQGSSARSNDLSHCSPITFTNVPPKHTFEKYPKRSSTCHHSDLQKTPFAKRLHIGLVTKRTAYKQRL